MRLPDGTILMHDAVHAYDPVKAREYYLRTRKLKGRKKGIGAAASIKLTPKAPAKGLPPKPAAKKVDPKVLAKQRKDAAARVTKLKEELRDLTKRLKEKQAEAKEAEAKAKRGPTAAEKAESARDSKKYRDKNKQKIAAKAKKAANSAPATEKKDTVESLQKQVAEVKGRLTAAVDKLRSLG